MNDQELLISRITQPSEGENLSVLDVVTHILKAKKLTQKLDCLYCGHVLLYK